MPPLPQIPKRIQSPARSRTAAVAMFALAIRLRAYADDHVSAKWQDYAEDDDRIRVISYYFEFEKKVSESFAIRGHGVNDAITGATPLGSPNPDGSVPLSDLEDERNAGVIDVDWTRGARQTTFQYAHSRESDFLSRGYAATHTEELNKRNTALTAGLSFIDDSIFASVLTEKKRKDSWDGMIGLRQVIDPNSSLALNLSAGRTEGYLSDPYKTIRQDTEVLPGIFLPLDLPENRPSSREKRIVFLNYKRYIDRLRASLDLEFRHYSDDWGIDSQTLDIEWLQKLGERLVVIPKLRFYRQSAADFYLTSLSPFVLAGPDESPLHYSADYRLSALRSTTAGAKLVYRFNDSLSFDFNYERYLMDGRDDATPDDAYPESNVATIGARFDF